MVKKKRKEKKYIAKPYSFLNQEEVDIVAPYLFDVLFPDGIFDKETIVEDAKDPSSPLHDLKIWDWNDKTAAHQHRLSIAQKLITSFYVITPEKYKVPSVVSIRVHDESSRSYVATEQAIENPDHCKQIIQQAINGILAWKKRYEMFMELPQFADIAGLIAINFEKGQTTWQRKKQKALQKLQPDPKSKPKPKPKLTSRAKTSKTTVKKKKVITKKK